MKRNLIIGIRKTHKYVENHKVSDYLVPYTSSGCTAMCLYCYLVCNYNKCAYLRLFVNREQMMDRLIKVSFSSDTEKPSRSAATATLCWKIPLRGNLGGRSHSLLKEDAAILHFRRNFTWWIRC